MSRKRFITFLNTMLVRFLLVTCYLSLASLALDKNIKQIYEWHGIPYGREDPHQQKTAEEAANKFPDQLQNYDLRGIIISDVDLWKNGRVFITIPRHEELPASLLTFSNNLDLTSNNFLWPYPDWTWAKSNDCNAIVNAYGIAVSKILHLTITYYGYYISPHKISKFVLNRSDRRMRQIVGGG